MITRRLHGFAVGRWVWWATLTQTALVVSLIEPRWTVAAIAGLTGLWLKLRGAVPYGWLISVPLGAFLLFAGWERTAILLIILVWLWAVISYVRWDYTTLRIDQDHLEIWHGVINQRRFQVPRRQLAQLKDSRWPWARLFGYTHIRWETAAQVEFQDRLRYVHPELYRMLTDSDTLNQALEAA